jgi:hypothetical protein
MEYIKDIFDDVTNLFYSKDLKIKIKRHEEDFIQKMYYLKSF